MVKHLDMKVESERVRETAEDILKNGGSFQPMIGVFERGDYRGAIVIRPADDDEDRKCAFAEACMLIPFLHADEVVVSFDAYIHSIEAKSEEVEKFEAINVMIASDDGADARMMRYDRDEEGNFVDWVDRDSEDDNINPNGLSGNMVATLAHFMTYHAHLEYAKLMMKSLSKRGHIILLPEGKQYIGGDAIEPEAQLGEMFVPNH